MIPSSIFSALILGGLILTAVGGIALAALLIKDLRDKKLW